MTPDEAREAIACNLERGLSTRTPEGMLYLAASDAIAAAMERSDLEGDRIPAAAGGAALAVSQAADNVSRRFGRPTGVAAILIALGVLVKDLDERRATLDARQARHLDLALRWITKYAAETTPRRRRIRWPWGAA